MGELVCLQVFLRYSLLGVHDAEETLPLPPSHPPPAGNKPVLMPCPSPITSPRLSPWPGSPLPSIPSLPSPRETPLGSQPGVMFTASTEQFKQLFAVVEGEGCSPMEGFLGGLVQLYQFVQQSSHQQIQPSVSHHWSYARECPLHCTSLFFSIISLILHHSTPPSFSYSFYRVIVGCTHTVLIPWWSVSHWIWAQYQPSNLASNLLKVYGTRGQCDRVRGVGGRLICKP